MWWIEEGGNRSVCFCDLRIFFFLERRAQGKGGEMGKVELVGLVEVVGFFGGGFGCGMWDGMRRDGDGDGDLWGVGEEQRSRGEGEEARKGKRGGGLVGC